MRPRDIRRLRRLNGWTQAELAEQLGTDPVTVSRWERGVAKPRPSAVKRLDTFALDLPPEGTLGFAEDPDARIRRVDRARREQIALKEALVAGLEEARGHRGA